MKKVILILLLIMIVFFTQSFFAGGDAPESEKDAKVILNTVSPSIVKVITQSWKVYSASGTVIDGRHVISNAMVTRYPYKGVYIQTVNGKSYPARVIGKDRDSSLILLRVKREVLTPIKPAASYEVGDWTALVGTVYSNLPAMFTGIVSSVSDEDLIVNAPVMPGASGGAVIDGNGRLMGIIRGPVIVTLGPDSISSDYSREFFTRNPTVRYNNLCCAVPVKKVIRIIGKLKKSDKAGEMRTRIEEENRLRWEAWERWSRAWQKLPGDVVRDAELMKGKTWENYYKTEIEKLHRRLQNMSKEIKKLRKQLEKKEKDKALTTTI